MAAKTDQTQDSTPTVQWLKTAEMAARISRHPAVLLRMAKRGVIPQPARLGKACLWDAAATEAALQASKGGSDA